MLAYWVTAIGLFLIIEGLMPVISPGWCRRYAETLAKLPFDTLRMVGLSSMIVGVLLIILAN